MMAAGLLTAMTGALSATALGTGTVAVMMKAAWLRNWLYHGPHLLYGVSNLAGDLRTLPAIAYSHELTGAEDSGALFAICIGFPLIASLVTACTASARVAPAAAGQGSPGRAEPAQAS
jgi:hypothetical protein